MKGSQLVIITGQLPQDCQTHSKNGTKVVKASIPTNEYWTDASGQKQESTEWHNLVFFGRLAVIAAKLLKKGSVLYVEGKNKTSKWVDKNNVTKYFTEIEVRNFELLNSDNINDTAKPTVPIEGSMPVNPKKMDDHMDEPIT